MACKPHKCFIVLWCLCTWMGVAHAEDPPIRVACVGDSITHGGMNEQCYPAQLQKMLGEGYKVENFGIGGATLIRKGKPNVWQELPKVTEFNPNIVIVSVGTNDTVSGNRANWEKIGDFDKDYQDLIDQLASLPAKPRLLICTPTSMVLDTPYLKPDRLANLTERKPRLHQLCGRVRQLVVDNLDKNIELVELNSVLADRPNLLTPGDGVHPNAKGYRVIASTLADRIKRTGRPNIVLFLVDDMGWQDTSVPFWKQRTEFNDHFRTPGMELLAEQGVRFTSAYAYPLCSPTRVSIMTGMNAARHHVTQWTLRKDHDPSVNHKTLKSPDWRIEGLQPPTQTLPRILKMQGYHTIHCGKAHFGAHGTPGEDPINQGFDVNIAGHCAGGPGSYHGDKNFSAAWRKGDRIWDVPGLEKYHGKKINLTEALTIEANAAIEKAVEQGNPFYLYMAHYAIHAPWEPDRRFVEGYRQRGVDEKESVYASMVESMDDSLSSIIHQLNKLGVGENTIILFASDNGGVTHGGRGQTPRKTGAFTHNWPLRSGKCSIYEGGIRVPMIVSWARPDRRNPLQRKIPIKAGRICDDPVHVDDFLPTICNWAEIDAADYIEHLDGCDVTGYITNRKGYQRTGPLIFHYPHVYCYIPDHGYAPHSAIIFEKWKAIYFYDSKRWELYDVVNDISETQDRSQSNPEVLRLLAGKLIRQLKSMGAQYPVDKSTGKEVPPVMPEF